MKYYNFKRNKFSTIIKNINLDKLGFKWINKVITKTKNIIFYRPNLKEVNKLIPKVEISSFNIGKYLNFKRYNFIRIYKHLFYSIYNYFKNIKKNFLKINKYFLYYFFGFVISIIFIYSIIPVFYKFDKNYIQNVLCKDVNLECEIKGKINYSFFPTPRIKVKSLEIKDIKDSKIILARIPRTDLIISVSNLFPKNQIILKKIKINKSEINFNLNNIKYYNDFFKKNVLPKPISLENGKIIFFDDNSDVARIENLNIIYKVNRNSNKIILKGDFLEDKINIILKNNKGENSQRTFEVKLPGLNVSSKGKIFDSNDPKKPINGNILIKNLKNRITGLFEYEKGKIIFNKASIRNNFLDGSFIGTISFLPYFNFDLDFELGSLNFTKLQAAIISLDKNKNLFAINNKLNGTMNITSNNVFSKSTLIDSFESKLSFINGDISLDKLILNIKKIGAADLTGTIKNDNKFTNLKFESNIFIDNLKKFYSKFGIYSKDKEKKPSNLFVSGNIDLINLVLRLNEIESSDKLNEEDILYIEKEFNKVLLEDRYESFFDFKRLKEFLKLVIEENN